MSILSAAIEKAVEKQAYSRLFDINGQGLNQDAVLLADVLALYANGEQGALYYFTEDFAGLYQDSLGVTPVTAVGQPVGLMLDRRFGLVRGVELIVQPIEFASPAWAKSPGVVESSGLTIRATQAGTISAPVLEVGKTYEIKASFLSSTATNTRIYNNASGIGNPIVVPTGGATPNGTYIFTAVDTSIGIRLGASGEAVISSFSIRELPGNHASQATTTARPMLQRDGNGKLHLAFDGVDDCMTFAQVQANGRILYGYGGARFTDGTATQCVLGGTTYGYLRAQAYHGIADTTSVNSDVPSRTPAACLAYASSAGNPINYRANAFRGNVLAANAGPTMNSIGAFNAVVAPQAFFAGNIYAALVRAAPVSSDEEQDKAQAFLASRAGITLPE